MGIDDVQISQLFVNFRDEAARVWEQRETDWAKERAARERLMKEVGIAMPLSVLNHLSL
jgi:hypothetical protein